MRDPVSLPLLPRSNLQPQSLRREDEADPGSNHKNQLVNHLLKDQEEDPKEAKTRVPLKQPRRKQKPLVKSDPEGGPENGLNKWFKRSLLRKRLKKRPHKNLQRKTRIPHHAISTSSAVGSFEGRRHCLDHLFSIAMVFPLLPGGKKIA